jgi:hypothetical protein
MKSIYLFELNGLLGILFVDIPRKVSAPTPLLLVITGVLISFFLLSFHLQSDLVLDIFLPAHLSDNSIILTRHQVQHAPYRLSLSVILFSLPPLLGSLPMPSSRTELAYGICFGAVISPLMT